IVATGPAPELEVAGDDSSSARAAPRELHLRATAPDGTVREAFLALADGALPALSPTVEALPLEVGTFALADLDVAGEPGPIPAGGLARFRADAPRTRWMATAGTFFERDRQTAVWAAGDVVVDDDEIAAREALDPGVATVLVI